MKWVTSALVMAATLGTPNAQKPAVIDAFESTNGWTARPSDGVSLRLSTDSGFRGRAMRLDFDFRGGGGYAVAHKAFNFNVPPNYEFTFGGPINRASNSRAPGPTSFGRSGTSRSPGDPRAAAIPVV